MIHSEMKETLLNVFENNKVSHGYLFDGSKGNIYQASIWMAQRFFCKDFNENGPCGTCRDCQRILTKNHPDVHFLAPDGQTIKIDQIRELREEFYYKGVEGNKKCFIIEEVDKMTVQAANSLLKFLEEPVEQTLAILLTEEHTKMLDTILSRVQRFRFPKVESEALLEKLNQEGADAKYLPILCTVSDDFDELLGWSEMCDQAVTTVVETLGEKDEYSAVLNAQLNWGQLFKNKEEQRMAVRLMKSYYKAILEKKKNQETVWETFFSLPDLDWMEVVVCLEACDTALGEFYSNKHFLLIIEKLLASISDVAIMEV